MRSIRLIIIFLACLVLHTGLAANPIPMHQVPDELKPWADWVLFGEESQHCPFVYHDAKQRRCAWPAALTLELDSSAGTFSQQWYAYTESWLTLPGTTEQWPQEVKLDGEDAVVVIHDGRPAVRVDAGKHRLAGQFKWSQAPESLFIPSDTGIIELVINGKRIRVPDVDANGKLWLHERDADKQVKDKDGDHLEIQVFRHINDLVPQRVTTRLILNVAGTQREAVIGKALLDGFIPLQITSRLPARLEPDGRLRVQLRPGKWTIDVHARAATEVTELSMANNPPPWPDSEIWSFEAQNHLRLVEIEGVPTVDPRQTNLPAEWRNFPAYRVTPGTSMLFKQIRRGDPVPAPDQLSLNRELWLDHEGGGYTVKDTIQGSITQHWRLEASPALQPGRVVIDGEPQFITTLPDKATHGVEVRRGSLHLVADSRMNANIDSIPAAGWQQDFQSVRANLHLPPGWDVFSVRGTDNVPHSWLQRWTLLDLFLVLIIGLSAARMWSWGYGLLALVTVTLLWHEPLAPTYIFLNLLAAIALLRVLPDGVFARIMRTYRGISLVALILIAVPFMVNEIRTGIYPQLEFPGQTQTQRQAYIASQAPETAESKAVSPGKARAPEDILRNDGLFNSYGSIRESIHARNVPLSKIDPKANIQTGPGLPQWHWRSIPLSWNGPVSQQQQVDVMFITPGMNFVLSFLRVILLISFSVYLFGIDYRKGSGFGFKLSRLMPVMLLAVLLPLGMNDAQAAFPNEKLLTELKTRLTAPPDCLPACAQSPTLSLRVEDNIMTLTMAVHALANTAIPIPAHVKQWLPESVSLNGKSADGLYRNPAGELWINVGKGLHQVVMRGAMPARNSFTLPLPLTPHLVEVTAHGWTVAGVNDNGVPDRQLQLTRLQSGQAESERDTLAPGVLPAFAVVYRTFRLGLDWQVETLVQRVSPMGNAIAMRFPLLAGESVITEDVRVENGRVQISLSPGQSQMHWLSTLEKQDVLKLQAAETTQWTEVWRADISPLWHVELGGIPVVHHLDRAGQWLPEWRPYAGETASLMITRPQGVEGQTLTIDDSRLTIKPGKRATASALEVSLRSSQGGQHTLTLPEAVELQSVTINGRAQPIRQEAGRVTLPIVPGEQQINLKWRDSRPVSLRYRTDEVGLGLPSVNHRINLQLGHNRWVLLTGGPHLGPAVLYWGVLIVIVLIAIILGRTKITPLGSWQWLLLSIGLSQVSVIAGLIVVGWLLAMGARCRLQTTISNTNFNAIQVMLGLLTLTALWLLVFAVQQGLLGHPDMMVAGNGSSAYNMNWYQDRVAAIPQSAWVLSVPMFVYRILMLAWALWLAFALLRWLKWGWGCYSTAGLWRKTTKIIESAGRDEQQEKK